MKLASQLYRPTPKYNYGAEGILVSKNAKRFAEGIFKCVFLNDSDFT